MIKADIRWNEERQATDVNINAMGKTLVLGNEFVAFAVTFAKRLDESNPGLGILCLEKALEHLNGDGGEKAPAPVTPITPIN